MDKRTLTVEVPPTLFDQLKERAERTHRSIEDEAVLTLAATISEEDTLPSDLASTLGSFTSLEDDALWRLARARVRADHAARLEELGDKRQREGHTNEMREAEELIERRDRARVERAEAAVTLKRRGHDVSSPTDIRSAPTKLVGSLPLDG